MIHDRGPTRSWNDQHFEYTWDRHPPRSVNKRCQVIINPDVATYEQIYQPNNRSDTCPMTPLLGEAWIEGGVELDMKRSPPGTALGVTLPAVPQLRDTDGFDGD